MISKLSIASLMLCSTMAYADSLVFHLRSHHSENNHDTYHQRINNKGEEEYYKKNGFNNNNLGIAYQLDSGYSAGVYYNSVRRTSFYAGKSWMFNDYLGVYTGAATGYKRSVTPFVSGLINIPVTEKYSVLINVIPTPRFDKYLVINTALVWKFD